MSRGRALAALVGVQLAMVGLYLVVERGRAPEAPFLWERVEGPAPPLALARAGQAWAPPEGPLVVHFWATWCAPCQAELPALLAAAEAEEVALIAITEEPWPEIEAWFGGAVPAAVVQDPSAEALSDWGVSGLPDTFLVDGGQLRARVGGPRDWSTEAARAFMRGELR